MAKKSRKFPAPDTGCDPVQRKFHKGGGPGTGGPSVKGAGLNGGGTGGAKKSGKP